MELTDQVIEERKLIYSFVDKIANIKDADKIFDVLFELYTIGKNIGHCDFKAYIQFMLDNVE